MELTDRLNKILHTIGGVSVGIVILAGTLCAGYLGGTRWVEKKDFVGQGYSTYKVYSGDVICRWETTRGGWVCKAMPLEFKEAIKTIFNFDGLETKEGDTVLKGSFLEQHIKEASAVAGVDPLLTRALIKQESNFNTKAISKKNCKGLMQLCSVKVSDPFNPVSNIYGGVYYLKSLLSMFNGDERLALAAYNAGEGAVHQFKGVPPYEETQNFVTGVLRNKALLKRGVEISSN